MKILSPESLHLGKVTYMYTCTSITCTQVLILCATIIMHSNWPDMYSTRT